MKIGSKKLLGFRILTVIFSILISLLIIDYALGQYTERKDKKLAEQCNGFDGNKFLAFYKYSLSNASYPPLEAIDHCNEEWNYVFHIDKNGFRYDENDKKRKDILAIGDSFTFGFGVQDNENFAALLHAYNGGLWANPVDRQTEALKRDLPLIKPKIIIWDIYPPHIITMMPHSWSDQCPGDAKYLEGNASLLEPLLPLWENSGTAKYLSKHSSLGKVSIEENSLYVLKNCYLTKEILLYDENLKNNHFTYSDKINKTFAQDRDHVYSLLQSYFAEAKKLEDADNAKFYFMIIPSRMQLGLMDGSYAVSYSGSKINPDLPSQMLTKAIVDAGFKKDSILYLSEAFKKQPDWRVYYYKIDAHWNAEGHKFAAEQIKEKLHIK